MRVLVLGASGFIGQPVAQALSRAGYVVFGQTRSRDKARLLAVDEIIPVIANPLGESCLSLVSTLDTIIVAVGGIRGSEFTDIIEAYITAAKTRRPPNSPKLTFIQTSGTWIHGDNRKDILTDGTPTVSPTELTRFLPEAEQLVVKAEALKPSTVSSSDRLPAKKEGRKLSVPGTPGARWPIIHTDDLAVLFLKAAERGPILGGLIIDAASGNMESVDDIMSSIAQLVGIEGYEYRPPRDLYEASIASSALLRPYLATSLLGWRAKKAGIVDGLGTYFASYEASL